MTTTSATIRSRPDLTGIALLLFALVAFGCAGRSPYGSLVPVEDGRIAMGTVLDVALLVESEDVPAARAAMEAAFERVQALERMASGHDPESAISALNAGEGGAAQVPPDLYAMFLAAEAAREATRGAFDVRVGPLLKLWGRASARRRRPSADEIAAARERVVLPVGLGPERHVQLESGMSVDLGGLAKGFALDRVVEGLTAAGVSQALLSFGRSSQWAGGRTWRLLVQDEVGADLGVVSLRDKGLSMSSSMSQSSVIEDVRYGHVVDPRSGDAIRERRNAVVVAATALQAEILSTALLVLDEQEAREVLAGSGAEARVWGEAGQGWETPGWAAATAFEASATALEASATATEEASATGD